MEKEIKIRIIKGEDQETLRNELLFLLNAHSEEFTGFELLGVLDVVRNDVYKSIFEMDGEK